MTSVRLAVDIGGTFTDAVLDHPAGRIGTKVPTTPEAPEKGFLAAARRVLDQAGLDPAAVTGIIHGTTLATNALIERKGARTALLTTEGFRDSLEIGYEARFDQYDLNLEKPKPLVPRHLRFGLRERMSATGEVLTPLDEAALRAVAEELRAAEVAALAIGFLHAYANPAHERQARAILAELLPGLPISLSSEVCPEIREYERLSTTVANAYIRPVMDRYLGRLEQGLRQAGFRCPLFLVTSAAGITTLAAARAFPIRLVESGPSGGAVLAEVTAAECGERAVLSYDMGGTTAKICLIDDFRATTAREFEAARSARFAKGSGLPLRVPVVEMIEIGAGGGSIASVDALNRIAVGPDSAGALPGPACYGKGGGRPTVTDADLALGRLDPARFAEGRLALDREATARVLAEEVGGPLSIEATVAAQGVCEMVDEAMANAARVHAAEHARDLRDYTLVAFGGAGPLHAGRLAEKLGIERLVVPAQPGVGSAVGFLAMPVSYEVAKSRYMTLADFDPAVATALLDALADEARGVVTQAAPDAALLETRTALMRYRGQGHEIEVALPAGALGADAAEALRARYERDYAALYGRALAEGSIEILTWTVTVATPRSAIEPAADAGDIALSAPEDVRSVFDPGSGRVLDTPVYQRGNLRPGMGFEGPALVVEAQTTTVVPAGFQGSVNGAGHLVLQRRPVEAARRDASDLDDLTLQVLWNRLQAVVDEQAGVLMRTAFSPIVRESGDLSVGVFDVEGAMLAQAVTGTPGHVNTMASACRKFFQAFPPETMRRGDIYLTNDPWLGAGHLNDFVLLKPCFHEDRLIGLLSCTSHLVDIGGRCLGPDGSDVYDEGLYVPPIRLLAEGRLDQTFLALLKANSRAPEQAEGDLFALIACCEAGDLRLREMMRDFAIADLAALSRRILETSERATRARIAALPDGTYGYEMPVDGYDQAITLGATLTVAGDSLELDFHRSAPPSRHGINVPLNYTEAYAAFGLKCAIAPDIPNNQGALAPFRVTAKPGSILDARKPAPVCSRHILGQLLPDVALGCLAQVLPAVVPAEGAATLWDLPMKGVTLGDSLGDSGSFAAELVYNGGTGARPARDGLSATAFPSGVMGSLVEIAESTTPILIHRRELRCDSGGAGTQRGGLGQVIDLQALADTRLTIYGTVDRVRFPARARAGGASGAAGAFEHSAGTAFLGKGACLLEPGERLRVLTPGGGGFGCPRRRDPDRVAEDLRDALISDRTAREVYAVVVAADGRPDEGATARLRNGKKGGD